MRPGPGQAEAQRRLAEEQEDGVDLGGLERLEGLEGLEGLV